MRGAELKDVGHEAHGGAGRVDVGAAGEVLLEDVVLHRPRDLVPGHPLRLGHEEVEGEEHHGRGVDGHAGGDLVQGDAVKELLHVLQGGDGHPHPPHLPHAHGVVGVQAELGGEVKGHGQPRLALGEEVAVAGVGLLGGGEARVLAHGPEPFQVHPGVDPPGEGVLPGPAELLPVPLGEGLKEAFHALVLPQEAEEEGEEEEAPRTARRGGRRRL